MYQFDLFQFVLNKGIYYEIGQDHLLPLTTNDARDELELIINNSLTIDFKDIVTHEELIKPMVRDRLKIGESVSLGLKVAAFLCGATTHQMG